MSESRRRFPPSLYYLFEIEVVFDGSSDSVCVQRPLVVEQGSLSSLSYAFDKLTRTATFGKQTCKKRRVEVRGGSLARPRALGRVSCPRARHKN